jgi:acetyltransferase-like isoleucine patch superfamily enzyme
MRFGALLSRLGFGSLASGGRGQLALRYPSLRLARGARAQVEGVLRVEGVAVVAERAKLLVPPSASLILHEGAYIGRDVELGPSGSIVIGERASLQDRCILVGDVEIGRYSLLSLNVLISSGRHYHRHAPHLLIRDQDAMVLSAPILAAQHSRPVRIEEDCWLGVNVVVMPGVTVGRGSVIGANAVVTRNVAPYSVMAGAPAKVIGERLRFVPPSRIGWQCEEDQPYFYAGFELAADQRRANAPCGGLVARRSFELWLDDAAEQLVLRVRCVGDGVATLRRDGKAWAVAGDWSEICVDKTAGPQRFELDGAAVCVAGAWVP